MSYGVGMKRKLTTKLIDNLPPAKGKRYEARDTLIPGLHLRVSATGRKVFYISARVERRNRRRKLGTYPALSLSDARERARDILRDIASVSSTRAMLARLRPQYRHLARSSLNLLTCTRSRAIAIGRAPKAS